MIHDCMIDMGTLNWDRNAKWSACPSTAAATQSPTGLVIMKADGPFRGNNFMAFTRETKPA